jgi:hypothetical protein
VWADISPTGFGYEIQGGLSGGSTTSQTPRIRMWEDALNGVVVSGATMLAPEIEEGVAKKLGTAIPFVGDGISAMQAWQTGMAVNSARLVEQIKKLPIR